jgi:pre-mRNA-splicing factor ISY1
MARNAEKAQSMLNRYLTGKQEEARGPRARRPYLASECGDLAAADRWRAQVLREVGRKVMEVQNAGLGEARLRELNDEINKLIREKGHWERRILELGGPDYAKAAPRSDANEGGGGNGGGGGRGGRRGGYQYFGAARALPGVRELFEGAPAPKRARRTRAELARRVDADYYGLRDEEDGALVAAEAVAEVEMRAAAAAEWRERAAAAAEAGPDAAAAGTSAGVAEGDEARFVAYVPLPEPAQIEARVLASKKAALVAAYASDALVAEQEEARALLNRR